MKLAEALLRRKELDTKVKQLGALKASGLFEVKVQRAKITDAVDDITATVPKLTASQVTREYDYYARALRLIDAAIQRANWETEVTGVEATLKDYDDTADQKAYAERLAEAKQALAAKAEKA